ncbi:polysaccharide pyruvyl transferase-domain-containing protein [Cladochytrium replicatum]|nr:polysaccharide pyruvyl transferase-domain-containing protein [Cladochytrium replicatum]
MADLGRRFKRIIHFLSSVGCLVFLVLLIAHISKDSQSNISTIKISNDDVRGETEAQGISELAAIQDEKKIREEVEDKVGGSQGNPTGNFQAVKSEQESEDAAKSEQDFDDLKSTNNDKAIPVEEQVAVNLSICDVGFAVIGSGLIPSSSVRAKASWVEKECTDHESWSQDDENPQISPKSFLFFPETSSRFSSDRGSEACHRTIKDMLKMGKALQGKQWFFIIDDKTSMFPWNLLGLLSKFDKNDVVLIGGTHFSILDKNSLSVLEPGRKIPYGPNESRTLLHNVKLVPTRSGYALSQGAMDVLLSPQIHAKLESMCDTIEDGDAVLTLMIKYLDGRVVHHDGFFDCQPGCKPVEFSNAEVPIAVNNNAINTLSELAFAKFPQTSEDEIERSLNEVAQKNVPTDHPPFPCADIIDLQQRLILDLYSSLLKGVERVAIIGFPDHPNKGDAAIWVGERVLLRKLGIEVVYFCENFRDFEPETVRSVLLSDPLSSPEDPRTQIPDSSAILFHGGGNFGDIWINHEHLRNKVVTLFPDTRIVAFPQSIHFDNITFLEKVQSVYGSHPRLSLVGRDMQSYELLKEWFSPQNGVYLSPDAAFMIGQQSGGGKTTLDVLFFQRTDKEHVAGQRGPNAWSELINFTIAHPVNVETGGQLQYVFDDWTHTDVVRNKDHDVKAWRRTLSGFRFLTRGRLVITNRLHGHILSTLLGLPQILLDNNYGKVSGYHKTWTFGCPNMAKSFLTTLQIPSLPEADTFNIADDIVSNLDKRLNTIGGRDYDRSIYGQGLPREDVDLSEMEVGTRLGLEPDGVDMGEMKPRHMVII